MSHSTIANDDGHDRRINQRQNQDSVPGGAEGNEPSIVRALDQRLLRALPMTTPTQPALYRLRPPPGPKVMQYGYYPSPSEQIPRRVPWMELQQRKALLPNAQQPTSQQVQQLPLPQQAPRLSVPERVQGQSANDQVLLEVRSTPPLSVQPKVTTHQRQKNAGVQPVASSTMLASMPIPVDPAQSPGNKKSKQFQKPAPPTPEQLKIARSSPHHLDLDPDLGKVLYRLDPEYTELPRIIVDLSLQDFFKLMRRSMHKANPLIVEDHISDDFLLGKSNALNVFKTRKAVLEKLRQNATWAAVVSKVVTVVCQANGLNDSLNLDVVEKSFLEDPFLPTKALNQLRAKGDLRCGKGNLSKIVIPSIEAVQKRFLDVTQPIKPDIDTSNRHEIRSLPPSRDIKAHHGSATSRPNDLLSPLWNDLKRLSLSMAEAATSSAPTVMDTPKPLPSHFVEQSTSPSSGLLALAPIGTSKPDSNTLTESLSSLSLRSQPHIWQPLIAIARASRPRPLTARVLESDIDVDMISGLEDDGTETIEDTQKKKMAKGILQSKAIEMPPPVKRRIEEVGDNEDSDGKQDGGSGTSASRRARKRARWISRRRKSERKERP